MGVVSGSGLKAAPITSANMPRESSAAHHTKLQGRLGNAVMGPERGESILGGIIIIFILKDIFYIYFFKLEYNCFATLC